LSRASKITRFRPRQCRFANARIGANTIGQIVETGQFAAAAELVRPDPLSPRRWKP